MALALEQSETSIANRALSAIRASASIVDLDADPGASAREIKLKFAPLRNFLQRTYLWNCTEEYATLPALATAPDFKWTTFADLPVDCLFVRELHNASRTQWKVISGRRLAAKIPAPLKIIYSKEEIDTSKWDPAFTEAMVKVLAAEIAPKLTESASIVKEARANAREVLTAATRADASEGTADPLDQGSWVEAMAAGTGVPPRPIVVIE